MDLYTREDRAPQWTDAVENYANGRPQEDPDVKVYLRGVAEDGSGADVRSAWRHTTGINHVLAYDTTKIHSFKVLTTANVLAPALEHPLVHYQVALAHDSRIRQEPKPLTPVMNAHRWMWLVLAIASGVWGLIAGASIFGDGGLDSGLAWFGVLGNIVLALSLFRLSRARGWNDR